MNRFLYVLRSFLLWIMEVPTWNAISLIRHKMLLRNWLCTHISPQWLIGLLGPFRYPLTELFFILKLSEYYLNILLTFLTVVLIWLEMIFVGTYMLLSVFTFPNFFLRSSFWRTIKLLFAFCNFFIIGCKSTYLFASKSLLKRMTLKRRHFFLIQALIEISSFEMIFIKLIDFTITQVSLIRYL